MKPLLKSDIKVTYRWQPPPDYPKPVQSLGTSGSGATVKLRIVHPEQETERGR